MQCDGAICLATLRSSQSRRSRLRRESRCGTVACRASDCTTFVTPHATLALAAGIHPKVVSKRLGHSTVAFAMDVYSHANPSMGAEVAETMAQLVMGAGSPSYE